MAYPAHMNPMEAQIINWIIWDAFAAGCTVSVLDECGPPLCFDTTDYEAVTAMVAAMDETTLAIRKDRKLLGCIWLVHGNDGHDVIANHHENEAINAILARAKQCADLLEARACVA